MAETVTLAHIGRLIPLAMHLHSKGHEVRLAADSRFDRLIGSLPFSRVPLFSISSASFLRSLQLGVFPYSFDTLRDYVRDDTAALREFKPDVVIGDFRLSLSVSARLAEVPYIQIINAYWSRDFALKLPVPELPHVKWLGTSLGQLVFDFAAPKAFRTQAKSLLQITKLHGRRPPGDEIRDFYLDADYVLFSDLAELIPLNDQRPDSHLFAGPIHWSPNLELPSWWSTLPHDKPWVCVSLGSSGDIRVLPQILSALSQLPVYTMLIGEVPVGVTSCSRRFASALIPNAAAFKFASLVIGNGGSPAAYMALREGVPYLGVPSNLDQFLMMACVRHAAIGDFIRASHVSKVDLADRIKALIEDSLTRKNIEPLQRLALASDPLEKLDSLLDRL